MPMLMLETKVTGDISEDKGLIIEPIYNGLCLRILRNLEDVNLRRIFHIKKHAMLL